ncbi:MAG: hypothetical protein V1820_02645 [archaeon]
MPTEKFQVKPLPAATADPGQIRELFSAVYEQSNLVEDFLRDSEEKFAELTRRLSSIEETVKSPTALLSQYSTRDTSVANSVSEMRNKQSELSESTALLRNELNKWENEINERFLTLERRPGFAGSAEMETHLADLERKVRAIDSASDAMENLITEISGRADAAYSGGALLGRVTELERKLSQSVDSSEILRRLQTIELRAASLEISVRNINQRIILLGPHVIE